jgi:hypothetical protein
MAKIKQVRKKRNTTAEAKVAALAASKQGELQPQTHTKLPKAAKPFWDNIVRARARLLWNGGDLERAVNLAFTRFSIQKLVNELDKEGDVIVNARGTQIANPKHTLLEVLSRREIALTRQLQLHAAATVPIESAGKMLDDERKAVQSVVDSVTFDEDDDDELIPYPKQVH